MRTPFLIVLVLAAVAVGMVTLRLGGAEPAGSELALPAPGARTGPASAHAARQESPTLVRPTAPEPEAGPEPVALPAGPASLDPPRALEGTLTDRFGGPVRERVLLLAAGQAHPPEGADLAPFVTAVTSQEGRFSLTLPNPGPWRLGVGAPGAPRLAPTPPRELDGSQRVQVVLSGSSALSVAFEEPPAAERVTIDLVTLREDLDLDFGERGRGRAPDLRGGRGRGAGGGRGGPDRGSVDRGTSLDGGRGGPREVTEEDAEEDAEEGDRRGAALAPADADGPPATWATLAGAAIQDLDLQGAGGRRGGPESPDRTGRSRGEGQTIDAATLGPPPETWRSQARRTVERDELAAGPVEFLSLPAGPVARLLLTVDGERFEGVARFTLAPDARVEVRVLPLVPGSGAVTYLTSTTALAADESPAGVTWIE